MYVYMCVYVCVYVYLLAEKSLGAKLAEALTCTVQRSPNKHVRIGILFQPSFPSRQRSRRRERREDLLTDCL